MQQRVEGSEIGAERGIGATFDVIGNVAANVLMERCGRLEPKPCERRVQPVEIEDIVPVADRRSDQLVDLRAVGAGLVAAGELIPADRGAFGVGVEQFVVVGPTHFLEHERKDIAPKVECAITSEQRLDRGFVEERWQRCACRLESVVDLRPIRHTPPGTDMDDRLSATFFFFFFFFKKQKQNEVEKKKKKNTDCSSNREHENQ